MSVWRHSITAIAAAAVLLSAAPSAHAQQGYPERPVRIIVGFPAGSGTDIFARMFAEKLNTHFKGRFVVENISGAASNNAALAASQAQPDGHTLFFATNANAISVSLYKQLRYKFPGEFESISLIATAPQVLVVNPKLNFGSVRDLIAAAKARPDSVLNANAGVGGGSHLAAEMLSMMSGAKILHIPYKATNEAMTDLIAGRVSMTFSIWPVVRGFIEDGRLTALAVTSETRMPAAPNIPTIAETGVPGFEVLQWFGFMAPKGTPTEIIKALADAIEIAQRDGEIKRRIIDNGGEQRTESRDGFQRFIENDIKQWAKAVAHAGLTID
jgi:tripartite-type tricarboxylate transporter receptor subunit TctC